MNHSNLVFLGGGMVAGYAAKQLVELGWPKGELAILSAGNAMPCERPPFSQSFLAGKDSEDSIKINLHDFYKNQAIDLKLQCKVASVDLKRKKVEIGTASKSSSSPRALVANPEYSWFQAPRITHSSSLRFDQILNPVKRVSGL